MTRDTVLEIMRGLIWMAGITTGPILLAGLVTGSGDGRSCSRPRKSKRPLLRSSPSWWWWVCAC